MWRFWLGVGLLTAFLGLSAGVSVFANVTYEPVSQDLEGAVQAALQGHGDEALDLAKQARRIWADCWHGTAAFSDHAPMDEIDGLFAQLEGYGQTGFEADLAALCARLDQLIQAVVEAQSLTWWNLL